MKRIIMTAALAVSIFAAGTYSTQAQVKEAQSMKKAEKQSDFEQVEVADLPDAVKESVKKKMKRAKIAKAFKNEKDQYKLEIKVGKAMKTVYMNKEGKLINPTK